MNICFTLTMPSNNAWDGKWSGDRKSYDVIRSMRDEKAHDVLDRPSYYYDFGDGWCAKITVRPVGGYEMKKLRSKSAGFCGYDWMIDAIIDEGEIFAPSSREAK